MVEKHLSDREVIETILANEGRETLDRFFELWDDDAVMELPFVRPPFARRVAGKAAIEAIIRPVIQGWRRSKMIVTRMLATEEPGVFVVEYRGEMELESNGRPHNNIYISIMQVRNGKLVFWREYMDPTITAEAYGPGGVVT